MITDSTFDHDEDQDFTRDFTASIDQDYITLFTYNKGQDFDKETAGKKASRATEVLFPYNFAAKSKYRTYQTDSGKNINDRKPPPCSPCPPGRQEGGVRCQWVFSKRLW
jgi:hypothetical protein